MWIEIVLAVLAVAAVLVMGLWIFFLPLVCLAWADSRLEVAKQAYLKSSEYRKIQKNLSDETYMLALAEARASNWDDVEDLSNHQVTNIVEELAEEAEEGVTP